MGKIVDVFENLNYYKYLLMTQLIGGDIEMARYNYNI